jgi:hypothetical protein
MTARKRAPKTSYANELVPHNGVTRSLKEWATELKIDYRTFSIRYARGLRGDDLFQDLNPYNMVLTVNGETHTLTEWAKLTGLPRDVIKMRAVRGWGDDRILRPVDERAPRTTKPAVDLRQRFRDVMGIK